MAIVFLIHNSTCVPSNRRRLFGIQFGHNLHHTQLHMPSFKQKTITNVKVKVVLTYGLDYSKGVYHYHCWGRSCTDLGTGLQRGGLPSSMLSLKLYKLLVVEHRSKLYSPWHWITARRLKLYWPWDWIAARRSTIINVEVDAVLTLVLDYSEEVYHYQCWGRSCTDLGTGLQRGGLPLSMLRSKLYRLFGGRTQVEAVLTLGLDCSKEVYHLQCWGWSCTDLGTRLQRGGLPSSMLRLKLYWLWY